MTVTSTHPIPRFNAALDEALDELDFASTVGMTAADEAESLVGMARGMNRLMAHYLRLMAGATRVCEEGAHRSVADFLALACREDRAPLAAMERLAHGLEERWRALGAAVAAGTVSIDKAHVIARCLERLSQDSSVSGSMLVAAEEHLVAIAPNFPASQIRSLGKKVLEVVAPELGETAEARALQAEEPRALNSMTLMFRPRPDGLEGVTEIRGRIPEAAAVRLKTYLEAYTSPRHEGSTPPEDRLPRDRKLALAFCAMLDALDPNRLPIHGGSATTVMVTIDLETLRKDLAAAGLSGCADGEIRITAAEARRLACTADLIPAVLGGKSEPLDLGRASRLFSSAQRKAMALRDKTCRAEGCSIPPPGAKHTISGSPGAKAEGPTWATASSSAGGTTIVLTTTGTCIPNCRTAMSGSTGGGELSGASAAIECAPRVPSNPRVCDQNGQ